MVFVPLNCVLVSLRSDLPSVLNVDMVSIFISCQANPTDPRTFPFILLGNKIDIDGGNSRVVRIYSCYFS